MAPDVNVIKLFCPYVTNEPNKRVFVPGRPFQLRLMFLGKGKSLPADALDSSKMC
jgi:hypothetical protein